MRKEEIVAILRNLKYHDTETLEMLPGFSAKDSVIAAAKAAKTFTPIKANCFTPEVMLEREIVGKILTVERYLRIKNNDYRKQFRDTITSAELLYRPKGRLVCMEPDEFRTYIAAYHETYELVRT
jgi:hypothetical protein